MLGAVHILLAAQQGSGASLCLPFGVPLPPLHGGLLPVHGLSGICLYS